MQVTAARWNLMRVGVAVIAVALAFVASPASAVQFFYTDSGMMMTQTSSNEHYAIYWADVDSMPSADRDMWSWGADVEYRGVSAGHEWIPFGESSVWRRLKIRTQMQNTMTWNPDWVFFVPPSAAGSSGSGSVSIEGTPTVHVASMPSIGEVSLEGTPTVAVDGFDPDFRSSMFGATVLAVLGLFVVIGHRLTRGR